MKAEQLPRVLEAFQARVRFHLVPRTARAVAVELPRIQTERWQRGIRPISSEAIEARERALLGRGPRRPRRLQARQGRGNYYQRYRPTSGVSAQFPWYKWTGNLMRSSTRFTTIDASQAVIDPDANYRGPIRVDRPVTSIIVRQAKARIFDARAIDAAVRKQVTKHVTAIIDGAVREFGR